MSMFNDIGWTAKGSEDNFPILKRPNCLRKESHKDIGRSLALETKPSCMGTAITQMKESGIPWPHRWCNDSEEQVIPFLQEPVRWVVEFCESYKERRPHTSMWILQIQNFYFESFTLRISSVCTEQFRIGVSYSTSRRIWFWQRSTCKRRRVGNSEPGDIEDHEFTCSELFREYSKERTRIWKQIARNYGELRIQIRSQPDCKKKKLRLHNSWIRLHLDNRTKHISRRWLRFWRLYSCMLRTYSSSKWSTIQSFSSNTWRNKHRTSCSSSSCFPSQQLRNWDWDPFSKPSQKWNPGSWYAEEEIAL